MCKSKHNNDSNSKLAIKTHMKDWVVPFVIEPSAGVDRAVLAILNEAYHEEQIEDSRRLVLKLKPHLSPIKHSNSSKENNPKMVELAKISKTATI